MVKNFTICIRTLVYIFKIQASCTKRTEKSFQLRFRVTQTFLFKRSHSGTIIVIIIDI